MQSGTAINVAQTVVQLLEDDPCFNAGRGSVLNAIGECSLDASIMDGSDLSCGAIANVRQSKNPIALARAVLDHSEHVLLCGPEADLFGINLGLPVESPEYFKTPEQTENWNIWKNEEKLNPEQPNPPQLKKEQLDGQSSRDLPDNRLLYLGTVGCVVRDIHGNLAAATSTGGLLGKKFGRVGDSPIIGAGTYANNKTCAVSCTGIGEIFIKHHVASAISARIEYLKETLSQACQYVIRETLPKNSGGVIAVNSNGLMELVFNTPVMSRGQANSEGLFRVGLDEWLFQND